MELPKNTPERNDPTDKEEKRCRRLGARALTRFTTTDKQSFRLDPAMGGLFWRFTPETVNEHVVHIQETLEENDIKTELVVTKIESGSDQQLPAFALRRLY